VYGMSIIHSNN